jgi:hypothetical protein
MGISGEDTFCRLCKDNQNCYYKQLAELKAENEALIEGLGIANKYVNKYHKTLREIKTIAKGIRGYLEVPASRDVRYEMDRILSLITKAEV